MDSRKNTKLYNEALLLVGSLLLIISFILFHYEKILEVNNDIKSTIESKIYKELTKNNDDNQITVDINVDYVEHDKNTNEEPKNNYRPNYIAFLEIDKINLNQGLLPKNNYYNYVDYHVQILDIADFPDVVNGTSNVAFFKNLYKLVLGDTAKVYYNSKIYTYSIVNIYKEDKDGSVNIYRDSNKTTLTLITCTKDDKTHQTIYILELIGVESY